MSKANGGRLYLVEIKRSRWDNEDTWHPLTAIRPSSDKADLVKKLAKYLARRQSSWHSGPYRMATFKRTRSEVLDTAKMVGKKS